MGSTKFESMSIVEEFSVTERIGSFDDAGAEIGIAKIGLSACTKHCPSENPNHHPCSRLVPKRNLIRMSRSQNLNTWR